MIRGACSLEVVIHLYIMDDNLVVYDGFSLVERSLTGNSARELASFARIAFGEDNVIFIQSPVTVLL